MRELRRVQQELRGHRGPRDGWEPAEAWSESCAEQWGAREQRDEPVRQELQEQPEPQELRGGQELREPAAP